MPTIMSEDCSLHVEEAGNPDGVPLIFSNSLGTDLSLWDGQINALSDDFRIIRYDTRGHGRSGVPTSAFGFDQLGKDVLAILDHLDIRKAAFCGISMGGATGLWLSAYAPDRFSKIIVANSGPSFGPSAVWNDRIALVRDKGIEETIPAVLERWFTPDFREKDPSEVNRIAAMLSATDVRGYTLNCAAIRDFQFEDQLENCAVPMLIIAGADDPATTPSLSQTIVSKAPHARYFELTAAHLSNIEAEADFNRAVRDFLFA